MGPELGRAIIGIPTGREKGNVAGTTREPAPGKQRRRKSLADKENTKLFGQRVVDGGVGWNSIFAVATGVERQVGDRLKLRLGYLYNDNPIPDVLTLFNTQLPAFNQQQFSLGLGFDLNRSLTMDFAWVHAFENTIEGPVLELPGTTIAMKQSLDFWSVGIGVRY